MPAKIEVISSPSSKRATVPGHHAAFDIGLSLFRKQGVMVPLGVPSAKNKPSNQYFQFKYSIQHQRASAMRFELSDVRAKLFFQMELAPSFLEPGNYLLSWDGFDASQIFDSQRFTSEPLRQV